MSNLNTDTSFFQLNDICLSIPPESISIQHKLYNNTWQTLRTRSSTKVKSGFSQIEIIVKCKFADLVLFPTSGGLPTNSFYELRNLVSQFRITPFCYVENQYLRDNILSGDLSENMALALRQLEIFTSPDQVNVVDVIFHFAWFNYAPFLKNFTFKRDIFLPDEVNDPKDSRAYRLLYLAEQQRVIYDPLLSLNGDVNFQFYEYKVISKKQYQALKHDYELYEKLQNTNPDLVIGRDQLLNLGFAANETNATLQNLFGNQSSQSQDITLNDIIQSLNSSIQDPTSFISTIQKDWKVVYLGGEQKSVKLQTTLKTDHEIEETELNKITEEEMVLLQKNHEIDLAKAGIVVTGLHISFENILATIPMLGYSYPTFQHIGSTDAVISLSFQTDSEAGSRTLSNILNIYNQQSLTNRFIPQGHRNIHITNDLLGMCGLRNFIIESKSIQTVPGQPGVSVGTLVFLDDSLNENTSEQIIQGQSFTTSFDIRNKIAKILEKNLQLVSNVFKFNDEGEAILNSEAAIRIATGQTVAVVAGVAGVPGSVTNIAITKSSYYRYIGINDNNHQVFKKLCEEYGLNLSILLEELVEYLQEKESFLLQLKRFFKHTESGSSFLYHFFGLTNEEIIGISKLQEDMYPVFQKNSRRDELSDSRISSLNELQKFSREQLEQLNDIETTGTQTSQTQDLLLSFMQDKFTEWQQFTSAFLDKILYSGLIHLPQFKEATDLIANNALNSGTDCYPDFPLQNLVSLLSSSKDNDLNLAFEALNQLFQTTDLGFKNISLSSLINPDFYFFNRVTDTIDEIVPSDIVKRATDGIIKAREMMEPAESDWMKKVYETNLLTDIRSKQITADMAKPLADKSLEKAFQTKAGQSYRNHLQRATIFAPNQLVGSITSAIKESSYGKDIIELPAFSLSNNSQNVLTNERQAINLTVNSSIPEIKHNFDTEEVLKPINQPNSQIVFNGTIETQLIDSQGHSLQKDAAINFKIMAAQARQEGINLVVNSAYRDNEYQAILYEKYLVELAKFNQEEITERPAPAAAPGKSKHNQGLAVDIQVEDSFESTVYMWLDKNAPDYGFINTGKNFKRPEPWHWEFQPDMVTNTEQISSIGAAIDPNNESLLTKSLNQLQKDIYTSQGYTMMRAYPTFKLYFIESDLGERKRYAFDDFFSYSAVKSIELIRSRKIAADLLLLELTNISGILSNRKFQSAYDPTKPRDAQSSSRENLNNRTDVNTLNENPIASLMLQPGVQIQLRLGYSNSPEELEKVFNGIITDVEFSETDDLVSIVCQSFAIELVQSIHGESKSWGGWFSGNGKTFKILEEVLASPEVVHFGRWEGGDFGRNTQRSLLTKRWKFIPAPQDDNIFAPQGDTGIGFIDSIIGSHKYTMYQTTLWDVIQEMTLRHPSYIASVVPYDGKDGPRSTMFFGVPDQLYFARDSSYTEDTVASNLNSQIDNSEISARDASRDANVEPINALARKEEDSLYRKRYFELLKKQYGLNRGFIKPFRNYHIATSGMHIVYNNISASGHNTFNTATVQYGKSAADPNEKTGQLDFDGSSTFTLKADAAIPDEDIRELSVQYPNCIGEEVAKNYCLSLLFNSLKDSYKGNLVLIGNPKIKPFDIVYCFDTYNDLVGPIEVEQVIHKFSQETGFITEVTPDMVVHVNQHSTLSTSDAMGYIAEYALKKIGVTNNVLTGLKIAGNVATLPLLPLSPLAAMFFNSAEHTLSTGTNNSPLALIGTFVFKKLITRTQLAHPFRFSPLVLQSHPMIGGLPNRKTDGGFFQPFGEWKKDFKDYSSQYLEHLMDKFNPNNWLDKSEGDIKF
jgi:LAS superfamily LD-carboxypeptidase LdcB